MPGVARVEHFEFIVYHDKNLTIDMNRVYIWVCDLKGLSLPHTWTDVIM